jgi:hypothetical protein
LGVSDSFVVDDLHRDSDPLHPAVGAAYDNLFHIRDSFNDRHTHAGSGSAVRQVDSPAVPTADHLSDEGQRKGPARHNRLIDFKLQMPAWAVNRRLSLTIIHHKIKERKN